MQNYSIVNKFLHRFYLSNYFISKSTLELERELYEKKINNLELNQVVFISGLARSGTTYFMREIFETDQYASLQYNNMPFLFLPNLWKNRTSEMLVERAHKDGIKVNSSSPEEFDEYFWKAYLNDSYLGNDTLELHNPEKKVIDIYLDYIKLISISKNKSRYITKNNNNLLRLSSLQQIPNSKFFFLVRKPLDHASSLLKLHQKFSRDHKSDSFTLEYFNFLGHHEFGLNQKVFNLEEEKQKNLSSLDKSTLDYWLLVWLQYYTYLLNKTDDSIEIILFEDLILNRGRVFEFVNRTLDINVNNKKSIFSPPKYNSFKSETLTECEKVYGKLKKKIKYL